MSKEIFESIKRCNFVLAAFELTKGLAGGVYREEIVAALDLFTKLPCAETAVNLIDILPQTLFVIKNANDTFIKINKENLGPHFDGLEESMEDVENNLNKAREIHEFLHKGTQQGEFTVGFHASRNQRILIEKLSQIGIRKGFLKNERQFLRDEITNNVSAYLTVINLICIHGIAEEKEEFWNALGAQMSPEWHYQSEIFYNITPSTKKFISLLNSFPQ